MDSNLKNLATVYLVFFFTGLAIGLDAIVPIFFASVGVGVAEWGILAAMYGLGMLLFEATWGMLSDNYGKIVFMVGGLLLCALVLPPYMLTVLLPVFLFLQFLRGSFVVMPSPTGRTFVSGLVTLEKRGAAMGVLSASLSLGVAVGSLIFGYVAEIWSFAAAFYLCSAIVLASALFALITLKRLNPHDGSNRMNNNVRNSLSIQSLREAHNLRMVFIILVCAVICFMQFGLIRTFIPVYASQVFASSPFIIGLIQAMFSGFCVVFLPICGIISDRIGRKSALLAGFFLCFAGSILYVFAVNVHQLLAITIGISLGVSLLVPTLIATIPSMVPQNAQGAAVGLYGSFENLGIMIAPIIYALAWNFSPVHIFYVCSATQILGIALALLLEEKKVQSRIVEFR